MRRIDLHADCASCAALCCVATSFDVSDDFAIDKAAGIRCPHARGDDRCAIHDQLSANGFAGCAIYDCYGAGPRVTRSLAGASDAERNEAFLGLRVVHELLWLLTEAAKLCPASHADLGAQLSLETAALDAIAAGPLHALRDMNLRPRQDAVRAVLLRVGRAIGGRQRALPVVR